MRIYHALPFEIKHRDVEFEGQVCLTLVMRGLPLAILRTCRKANKDAKGIFQERICREILTVPSRIILRLDWDTSIAARHNIYLLLSAIARSIDCAKGRIELGDKSLKTILWHAEDKCPIPPDQENHANVNLHVPSTCGCTKAVSTTRLTPRFRISPLHQRHSVPPSRDSSFKLHAQGH